MGQKINPKTIRIVLQTKQKGGFIPGIFFNNWYSDYKYNTFFFQDMSIRKNIKRLFLKYYKTKARFLKGRRRRLKSFLRLCSKSLILLRFSYKIRLFCSLLRPSVIGLQRKHTAFIYKNKIKKKKVHVVGNICGAMRCL